jgi:hypothetical protein
MGNMFNPMKKRTPAPPADTLRAAVVDFCQILDRVPAVHFWDSRICDSVNSDAIDHDVLESIRNSLIESSLLSIRILDGFFRDEGFPTDVKWYHYSGFNSSGGFLTDSERIAINKYVAHMTVERAEMPNPGWYLYRHIVQCYMQSAVFLTYIQSAAGAHYKPDIVDISSRLLLADRIESDIRLVLSKRKKHNG